MARGEHALHLWYQQEKMRNRTLNMFKFGWPPWTRAEEWWISWNPAQLNKKDHEKVLINKKLKNKPKNSDYVKGPMGTEKQTSGKKLFRC